MLVEDLFSHLNVHGTCSYNQKRKEGKKKSNLYMEMHPILLTGELTRYVGDLVEPYASKLISDVLLIIKV